MFLNWTKSIWEKNICGIFYIKRGGYAEFRLITLSSKEIDLFTRLVSIELLVIVEKIVRNRYRGSALLVNIKINKLNQCKMLLKSVPPEAHPRLPKTYKLDSFAWVLDPVCGPLISTFLVFLWNFQKMLKVSYRIVALEEFQKVPVIHNPWTQNVN